MSMAEYMCKLFYGRRGIQLNEEQFSILFPNRSSSYLGLNFSNTPNKTCESTETPASASLQPIKPLSRESWGFSELPPVLNQITPSSTYPGKLTQNTNLPSIYPPFHVSSFNFSTPHSTNTPYFSYLQTTAHPSHSGSFNHARYTDVNSPVYENSEHNSDTSKDIDMKNVHVKDTDSNKTNFTTEGEHDEPVRSESVGSKSPEEDVSRNACAKWNNNQYNQESYFLKPIQYNSNNNIYNSIHHTNHIHSNNNHHNYNIDWNSCNFNRQNIKLLDLDKPTEISGVKKESCIYLPYSSNIPFADCGAPPGDKAMLNPSFELISPAVDGFVTALDLDLNCNTCVTRHPPLGLLQNHLGTDYSGVFNNNHYQLNYPSCSKDFTSRSQCLMTNRIQMEVPCKMKSLQHMCAVCGDHAACQHYGVRTCEGCKGFFKRTVQKGAVYVCLSGKNCPIDKRRRNRCQFCRFEKCLSVGMVKEVVRTDLLKGRRGRLPSKPKTLSQTRELSISPPTSFLTSLVRAYVDSSPDTQSLDYSYYNGPLPNTGSSYDIIEPSHLQPYHNLLCNLLEDSIRVCVEWSSCLTGFDSLCHNDQQLLFHASLVEVIVLRMAFKIESTDNSVTFCNGVLLDHRHYSKHLHFSWLENVIEFSRSLKCPQGMHIDLSTFSCLLALSMITHRTGLEQVEMVDNLQSLILEALRNHHENQGIRHSLLPATLVKISELRTCANKVLKVFEDISKSLNSNNADSIIDKLIYFSNLSI